MCDNVSVYKFYWFTHRHAGRQHRNLVSGNKIEHRPYIPVVYVFMHIFFYRRLESWNMTFDFIFFVKFTSELYIFFISCFFSIFRYWKVGCFAKKISVKLKVWKVNLRGKFQVNLIFVFGLNAFVVIVMSVARKK